MVAEVAKVLPLQAQPSVTSSEDIGKEMHSDVDQFFRIEQGEGEVVFNDTERHPVHDGDAIVVPAGTWHNVINRSKTAPLRVYTLYAPPNHADGTVHRTKAEAEAAEPANTAGTSVVMGADKR